MVAAAVAAVAVVRVVTRGTVVPRVWRAGRGWQVLALDLGGCGGQEVDVQVGAVGEGTRVVSTGGTTVGVQARVRHARSSVGCKGVWWRDVGRADGGHGRRARDALAGRRHHLGQRSLLLLLLLLDGLSDGLLGLVATARVRVVVNAGVSSQLVGARETLRAAWELAGMWFLTRVSADVASLMLETVEGLVTQRALVGSGQVLAVLARVLTVHHRGWHHADGGHLGILLL